MSASLVIGFTDASGIFQNVHLDTNTFPSPLQEFQIDRRIGNTLNLGQWIFRLDQIPYGSTGAKAQCRTRYFADDDFNVLDLVSSRICPCQYDPFDADFISCLRPRDTLSAEAVVGEFHLRKVMHVVHYVAAYVATLTNNRALSATVS